MTLPRPAQIWLLEDSPTEMKRASEALSQEHAITWFSDGVTLVEKMSAGGLLPDAVVLDWQVPGMTGLEVCRFVRERHDEASLPVLMMTGARSDNRDVLEGLDAGANDYLLKPYHPSELVARVRTLVRIRRLFDAAQSSEAQLRRSMDFEKHLIGIVSHDLRNPLAAITTGAGLLLRRDEVDGFTAKTVGRILSSAERMNRMIHDLLDYTQARGGNGLRVQLESCDLHEILRQTLDEVGAAHPDRDVRVEVEGSGWGRWDADRIAQVVTNLTTNAITYSPADSVVSVKSRLKAEGLTLTVHNAGQPIDPATLAHLFEPMRRGPETDGRSVRSVGLGLYIVKELVTAHGGHIQARRTADTGTVFTVWLPLHAPASAVIEEAKGESA